MTAPAGDEQDALDMGRLADGCDDALNDLMQRHGQHLFHYLIRSLQDENDAADLAQETFARVYHNRHKFDQTQKFTTWLYTIASNLVRDRYRWRSRHPQVSLDAESPQSDVSIKDNLPSSDLTPDQRVQQAERVSVVKNAIAALPEELRQPLILTIYQGLSQAEVAIILKCSVKAVETRVYRARQQLRASLADLMHAI